MSWSASTATPRPVRRCSNRTASTCTPTSAPPTATGDRLSEVAATDPRTRHPRERRQRRGRRRRRRRPRPGPPRRWRSAPSPTRARSARASSGSTCTGTSPRSSPPRSSPRPSAGRRRPPPSSDPLVDDRLRSTVQAHVDDAVQRGGGPDGRHDPRGAGTFYPATVLTDCTDDMLVVTEETFGPIAPVRVVESFDEGLRLAAADRYGLAATVLTGDTGHALRAAAELPVGTVKVNAVFGGAPAAAPSPAGPGAGFGYGHNLLDEIRPPPSSTSKPLPPAPPPEEPDDRRRPSRPRPGRLGRRPRTPRRRRRRLHPRPLDGGRGRARLP